MAITNWPKNTRPLTAYYQEYMQRPKQPYPRVPKHGSVNMELQEPSPYEPDYAGVWIESKPSYPSTTEVELSAASKRKTITLNERARPSISTTEKSPSTTQPMSDADYQLQLKQAVEYLNRITERRRQQMVNQFYAKPSPYYD